MSYNSHHKTQEADSPVLTTPPDWEVISCRRGADSAKQ